MGTFTLNFASRSLPGLIVSADLGTVSQAPTLAGATSPVLNALPPLLAVIASTAVTSTVIACSVVVFVIFTARRLNSRGWAVALGLLLAGSLGNLTDRMFRAPGPGRGHVVDFVQLPHFAIFNVADSAIVTAAGLIALLAFRGVGIDGVRVSGGKHEKDRPGSGTPAGDTPQDDTTEPEPSTGTDHDV